MPTKISSELCEEIGIHIGDGSVYATNNRFEFRISGNPKNEWTYFLNFLSPLYKRLFGIAPHIRREKTVICLAIYSKAVVTFKTNVLGIPAGKKTHSIDIPKIILENREFFIPCLRGIFDSDGCVYFDKSQNRPMIDITSVSYNLRKNIKQCCRKLGLSVYSSGEKNLKMQGWKDFNLWVKLIGSSNPKNIIRINDILSRAPMV